MAQKNWAPRSSCSWCSELGSGKQMGAAARVKQEELLVFPIPCFVPRLGPACAAAEHSGPILSPGVALHLCVFCRGNTIPGHCYVIFQKSSISFSPSLSSSTTLPLHCYWVGSDWESTVRCANISSQFPSPTPCQSLIKALSLGVWLLQVGKNTSGRKKHKWFL